MLLLPDALPDRREEVAPDVIRIPANRRSQRGEPPVVVAEDRSRRDRQQLLLGYGEPVDCVEVESRPAVVRSRAITDTEVVAEPRLEPEDLDAMVDRALLGCDKELRPVVIGIRRAEVGRETGVAAAGGPFTR